MAIWVGSCKASYINGYSGRKVAKSQISMVIRVEKLSTLIAIWVVKFQRFRH